MNIRKDLSDMSKCASVRCRQAPAGSIDVMGQAVPLCAKHLAAGRIELGADAGPPEVESESTAITPYADVRAEMVAEQVEVSSVLAEIQAFEIGTNADQEFAADMLAETKGNWKRLEVKKKTITTPLNESLKAVRALFRPAQDQYVKIENVLKEKLILWAAKSERENQAALAAAQAAHALGDGEAVRESLAGLHDTAPAGGTSIRKTWDYRLTDLARVPREYLCLDGAVVKLAIKTSDGRLEIPGVEIFQKETIASISR